MNGIKYHSKHPLYKVWTKIKDRLYNPNHVAYHLYGGDGVVMCKEWVNSPKTFIRWALKNGWKPGLHIDKDIKAHKLGVPAKIYSPKMCSIVTPKENYNCTKRSRFIKFNGKEQTLFQWCTELGFDYATMHHRIFDFGYSIEDAFNIPIGAPLVRILEYNGLKLNIKQWCERLNCNRSTFVNRLKRNNWSLAVVMEKYFNEKTII